ncbi:MAG: hypothetical protein ABIH00_00345, partial [Armatimonadota bacterium]
MHDLKKKLSKYKLDELLFLLSESSRNLYIDNTAIKQVEWQKFVGKLRLKFPQLIPAWALTELSYRAILSSNDYRHSDATLEDVFNLCNLLAKTKDESSNTKIKINPTLEEMKIVFWGHSQVQFWYQDVVAPGNIYRNFLRYFILLYE